MLSCSSCLPRSIATEDLPSHPVPGRSCHFFPCLFQSMHMYTKLLMHFLNSVYCLLNIVLLIFTYFYNFSLSHSKRYTSSFLTTWHFTGNNACNTYSQCSAALQCEASVHMCMCVSEGTSSSNGYQTVRLANNY